MLSDATYFAHKLERRLQQRKQTSKNVIAERRRKLMLDLKEHLVQAYNGTLEGDLLSLWLKELQNEFVNCMTAINEEETHILEEDAEDCDEYGMADMEYESEELPVAEDYSRGSANESPKRPPTVISIDSRMSLSSKSTSILRSTSDTLSTVRAVSENPF